MTCFTYSPDTNKKSEGKQTFFRYTVEMTGDTISQMKLGSGQTMSRISLEFSNACTEWDIRPSPI